MTSPLPSIRAMTSAACSAALLSLSACATAPLPASIQPERDVIEYTVDLTQPQTQYATFTMTARNVSTPTLDVALPIWRPGRYVVLDHATTVTAVRASDASGAELPITKIDKSTWRVQTGGASTISVSYRVYANSINDRTRHIDDTHAFLSPASVFMYAPSRRAEPLSVKIIAPQGWNTATGLEPAPNHPDTFIAPNYDVLVDSPLEIGIHDKHTFDVDGIPHEIVIWQAGTAASPRSTYDADQMKRDFAAIVKSEADIFGSMPYSRYVFMIHAGSGLGGGTEHLNSTIMQTSRATLEDPGAYRRFQSLVSHEFFHTWNVKHLRPADLKPYDYAHEDYTRLLWVAEGTTCYYDEVCLVRAGLRTPDEFLGVVASLIEGEMNRPGWDAQSLEDSSFDAWVKFNKSWPDSTNTTVSFYSKGSLISLLLDVEIRRRSNGAASLDTVMRDLYERFPLEGPGYTTDDLLASIHKASGADFTSFFKDYVAGAARPDFAAALKTVGLDATVTTNESEPYLGLQLADRDSRTVVTTVLADGPAFNAGLMADDEILALNNRRLRAGDLDARIRKLTPGDTVTLSLIRRDELRSIPVTLAPNHRGKWTVRRMKNPSPEQRAAYTSWLGQDWKD